jgi:hypothetical protein
MTSPRAGIALRPELARSGLFNSMMGKFLRKIGRDKQREQHKKSVYIGKEEVWERIWFVARVKGREGFRVRDVNWGFYGQKDLGRGARGAERRLRVEIREGLDIGNLLLFFSAFTEGVAIPENVRVRCAI